MVGGFSPARRQELALLYLPEEVLRHIFGLLLDAEVYFKVRCVCRQLRDYIDDYIRVGE